jgi:anaphase-promoting complex subunit 4
MDIVSCLTLVGHKILLLVMDELDLFAAFSTWLRFQIDRLAASSSAGDELTEKEATMENGKVLAYIQTYLVNRPADIFFDEVAKEDYTTDWDHADSGSSLLEMLDKQLKRQEDGQPYMKALPHVEFLVAYLQSRANGIFKSIADAQRRSVRFGQSTRISLGQPIGKIDARMCAVSREVSRRLMSSVLISLLTNLVQDGVDGLNFTALCVADKTSEGTWTSVVQNFTTAN